MAAFALGGRAHDQGKAREDELSLSGDGPTTEKKWRRMKRTVSDTIIALVVVRGPVPRKLSLLLLLLLLLLASALLALLLLPG